MPRPAVPGATYRVQLHGAFGFDRARQLLPYLARLGVDTLYLSPVTASVPGSRHGYDGVDPNRLDEDRGGLRAFARLCRDLRRHRMGLLVDIVPNHLAAVLENPAWFDVLRRGPASRFAHLFDIDWGRSAEGRPALVLPWLERPVEEQFRRGRVGFVRTPEGWRLRLGARHLPLSSDSVRRLRRLLAKGTPRPTRGAKRTGLSLAELNRDRRLRVAALRTELLALQHYRLVVWRETRAINYRRFFDIDGLAGVRSDTPRGFRYTHSWLLRAVRAGHVQGVRIDHIDGLADPRAYLGLLDRSLREGPYALPRSRVYRVVEKILERDEEIPEEWPVDGTTGYDALARIVGVLMPDGAERELDRAYRRSCPGAPPTFEEVAYAAKREVQELLFPGERDELLHRLAGIGNGSPAVSPRGGSLEGALTAVTSALSVYRTYAGARGLRAADQDRLRDAFRRAAAREGHRILPSEWQRLRRRFAASGQGSRRRQDPRGFLIRWQQYSAAIAAKGIEDTAFYRYARFLGANEVGRDPSQVGCGLSEFHRFMARRARGWPLALTATSTHDTKWGEDAHARFVALAELAGAWGTAVRHWQVAHRRLGRGFGGGKRPSFTEEYRLYQVWVATAPRDDPFEPSYVARLVEYMRKSLREAKEHSRWAAPDTAYERTVERFIRTLASGRLGEPFRRSFRPWVRRVNDVGAFYSLALVVLRSTVPGIPDLYQGSEGWNLNMVDPDNRRPVDYRRLARLLSTVEKTRELPRQPAGASRLGQRNPSEKQKLEVTRRLLRFRREHRRLFLSGGYRPLAEGGPPHPNPVIAFVRRHQGEWLVVLVARGLASVVREPPASRRASHWAGRGVPLLPGAPSRWRDALSGRVVQTALTDSTGLLRLDSVFRGLPVAVLYGRDRSG